MAKNFDEELTGGRRVRGKDDIAIRAVGYILIGVFALICDSVLSDYCGILYR